MSREIKFRAWDGESVRYDVAGFENGIKNEMEAIFLDGDVYSLSQESFTARIGRHAVAMQYTGLKDKSGAEIYEGDLIKVVGAESGEMIVPVRDITWMELSTLYPAGEVIGNIYENPELLEKVNETES